MKGRFLKGNFVCEYCKKNQTWVYQELLNSQWGSSRLNNFIVYEPQENEAKVYEVLNDGKTGYVNCNNRRCDHPNTINLEEGT